MTRVSAEPTQNAQPLTDPVKTTPAPAPILPLDDQLRLDKLILEAATRDGCKVALLIAQVTDAAKAANFNVTPQMIASRIYVLADIGNLAVQGNVRRWRNSEVKRGK